MSYYDYFLERQKITPRGWRKESHRHSMARRGIKTSFGYVSPVPVKKEILWSFDVVWTNPSTLLKFKPHPEIDVQELHENYMALKENGPVQPIIIFFDIDTGKPLDIKNYSLAKAAQVHGLLRIPIVVVNCRNGEPINPNVSTEQRYARYWRFIPYDFDSPERVMTKEQSNAWKRQTNLINNRQLFSDEEWQKLRKSMLGTWKYTPEQNVKLLRAYLGNKKDSLKVRRIRNYLTGTGFRSGTIQHPSIDQLLGDLPE